MTNRSGAAISAAAGSRPRRSALGASALAILVITWTGAPVEALADTLLLKSGEEIEGTIIDATRNTVIVRRAIGGMRQMRLRDIGEVRIDLTQGEQISGQLLSWADGIYQLRSGDEVIRISDGAILGAPVHATAPPPRESRPRPAQRTARAAAAPPPSVAEKPAAAAAGESQAVVVEPSVTEEAAAAAESRTVAVEAPVAEKTAAAGAKSQAAVVAPSAELSEAAAEGEGPTVAVEASVAEEPAAAAAEDERQVAMVAPSAEPAAAAAKGEGRIVAIKASVDPAASGADGMVFRIELSRPAEQTVVVIYGTLDGTAKAGTDYEPQQGVITLAPGTEGGEVRVPLLEHQPSEGDKRFELFLMADPKVAEVVDKRIVATIQGDN